MTHSVALPIIVTIILCVGIVLDALSEKYRGRDAPRERFYRRLSGFLLAAFLLFVIVVAFMGAAGCL